MGQKQKPITQQQAIRKKSLEEKRASTDQQMISSKAEQQTITKKTSIARKQSTTSKPEDTEQSPPPFAGMKLKKATRIQRESREETLPFVELKHHEFEISPQDEESEKELDLVLTEVVGDVLEDWRGMDDRKKVIKKTTKKKKTTTITTDTKPTEEIEDVDEEE